MAYNASYEEGDIASATINVIVKIVITVGVFVTVLVTVWLYSMFRKTFKV